MNTTVGKQVALVAAIAALAAPMAQAGLPKHDGYKSSYPQLHQVVVAAGIPESSYPQAHAVLSGAFRTPAATVDGSSGVDWRDAAFGALVGAAATGLLAAAALWFRRKGFPLCGRAG